jgi:hypothetical protein
MVGGTGIEPVTPAMSTQCSPAELTARKMGGILKPEFQRFGKGEDKRTAESSRNLDQLALNFSDQIGQMHRF